MRARILFVSVVVLVIVAAVAAAALAGRGGWPGVGVGAAARTQAATSTPPAVSADATALGVALQATALRPAIFSGEPKGDLPASDNVNAFVRIAEVTADPPAVTIDVEQAYIGDSAARESARDHQPPPDDDIYMRNRSVHLQKIAVSGSTPVVLWYPLAADAVFGLDTRAQLTTVSFQEFAKRFADPVEGDRLRQTRYWVDIEEGSVTSVVEQYFP
jgi:hypothetical protein